MTFEEALKIMPNFLSGGLDPCSHKTAADLGNLAEHQMDMYDEGEDSDITTSQEREQARQFLLKVRTVK
jgi:hypothetical protein